MRKPWPVLLMVRSLGLGGTERQLTHIACGLDRASFAPHVACVDSSGFRSQDLAEAGVPVLELPMDSLWGASALRNAARLRRYIRENGILAVHTFDTPMNLFGVPAARAGGAPLVLSSQRAYRELTPPFGRRVLRVTDRLVDGVVVNCEAVRRHMIEDQGVPAERVLLCFNALDLEMCSGSVVAAGIGGPVVGVVCGLRREKDLPTLMRAFARISPAFPEAGLMIVGDGPARQEIEEARASLKLENRCVLAGAARNVGEWLRTIDVFVLPSVSEALSNSLMEAMAAGCCAIATRVGGNPELVMHGETGLLFPAGDEAALADCLHKTLADEGERRRLAAAGQAFVRERFSLKAACRRMGEIYSGLIEAIPSAR